MDAEKVLDIWGIPVEIDPSMPEGQVDLVSETGRRVLMTNIGRPDLEPIEKVDLDHEVIATLSAEASARNIEAFRSHVYKIHQRLGCDHTRQRYIQSWRCMDCGFEL